MECVMRIAVVSIGLRVPTDPARWITVPPQGYSGVHWVVAHLVDGLLGLGHHVFLLGAPGSPMDHPRLTVVDAGEVEDTRAWLTAVDVDVVHDHSCGQLGAIGLPYVSTHHMTGRPDDPRNCVYLSHAQRRAAGSAGAPVVRIPVNEAHYEFSRAKDDYLLFLGRISTFKGVYEAAAFAHAAGRPLVVAGPSWEDDYRHRIESDYKSTVDFVGEVGGQRRVALIARAAAVMVLSQTVMGPWGARWCEPGATVVSEAAVSGTPVVATGNGCLPEIASLVGAIVPEGASFTPAQASAVLAGLPKPDDVRAAALAQWGHLKIARQHEDLYRRVCGGEQWT
jgi:glycosyltransferase involved in cell wall biosynthesis